MISQCPQCHKRLTDFAVACDKCGWSIAQSAAEAVNGTHKIANGEATTEAAPFDLGEDPPIIIVRNVAKTSAPPPPLGKATDNILPPELTGDPEETIAPAEVDIEIQRAMDYIELANYTSALNCLNHAIIEVPPERLAECFSLRGYVQLKSLEFELAEADCTQAINQHWEDAQTYA